LDKILISRLLDQFTKNIKTTKTYIHAGTIGCLLVVEEPDLWSRIR